MVNFGEDGRSVEVGTIGPEGFVGLPVLYGAESMASTVFIQVPGSGVRLTAAAFRRALGDDPAHASFY
jgi:CRP-like cAMP-binding protein